VEGSNQDRLNRSLGGERLWLDRIAIGALGVVALACAAVELAGDGLEYLREKITEHRRNNYGE